MGNTIYANASIFVLKLSFRPAVPSERFISKNLHCKLSFALITPDEIIMNAALAQALQKLWQIARAYHAPSALPVGDFTDALSNEHI